MASGASTVPSVSIATKTVQPVQPLPEPAPSAVAPSSSVSVPVATAPGSVRARVASVDTKPAGQAVPSPEPALARVRNESVDVSRASKPGFGSPVAASAAPAVLSPSQLGDSPVRSAPSEGGGHVRRLSQSLNINLGACVSHPDMMTRQIRSGCNAAQAHTCVGHS